MPNTQLPASLANFRRPRSIIDDTMEGIGSSRGPHISIRGGRFRLVDATGNETPVEEHHIDLIFIDANQHPARVYFEGEFVPGSDDPPVCFSDNGVGPSSQAIKPQAQTCAVCPRNVRGSATTFSGKSTTACDNRKKMAVIVPDDPAVNVYEFQIPPGSLSNLKAYGAWIKQQSSGVAGRAMDIADFVTRVAFDPDKQFVMTFIPTAFADDEVTLQKMQYIYEHKLSDQAVGRTDVPIGANVAIAAPAAKPAIAAQPAQQFQLPARAEANPLVEPAPKRTRGPNKPKPDQAASPAAPFMANAAAHPPAPAEPTQNGAAGGDKPGETDTSIPSFLRRSADAPSAPGPSPRFGVGAAPTPPAGIAADLKNVMDLPTRRT
jgi:hypothetical protein